MAVAMTGFSYKNSDSDGSLGVFIIAKMNVLCKITFWILIGLKG
jgi:hypothetical protein